MTPREHQNLIGHRAIVAQLKKAYDAGLLHHALIFDGPEGVGKETLAWSLVRYGLTFPQGNPKQDDLKIDAESRVSRQIIAGSHPNVFEITPVYDEKKERFAHDITIEALEGLQEFLRLAPPDSGARFVLIHPAESLNRFAQNAILKMLEEPPQKTFFILLTAQAGALLPTIRSRCLVVNFDTLDKDDFARGLPDVSATKIQSLYVLTNGALGRAKSYEDLDILTAYGDFCRAVLNWEEGDSLPAMSFAESHAPNSEEAVTDRLYILWLDRLFALLKAQITGGTVTPIIPEEARLLESWQNLSAQELVIRYDRLQALWQEGENAYLDRKLVLLRALAILSGQDNPKAA
jgi:DNA polymerase-3 subunit delta'